MAGDTTLKTYGATGIREDIVEEIAILAPIDALFYNEIGSSPCKARKHEFMTDIVAQPGANKQVEGSVPTIAASQQPVKIYNNIQNQEKSFAISDTSQTVVTVGSSGGYDYQKSIKMKALVGDMEYAFLREVRADGDDAGPVASSMRGALNWTITNLNKAGDAVLAADGTVGAGTARPLDKTIITSVLQSIFNSGGAGDGKMMTAYCGGFQKTQFDAIAATSNNRRAIEKDTVDDKVDLYITSFGTVKARINRTMPTDVFWIGDLAYWKKATLIAAGVTQLAKDSRNRDVFHMTVQHTLEARNEKTAGRITNLTTA